MKDIELKLDDTSISPHYEIRGHITVNYPGRYDGVVINTQIVGSMNLWCIDHIMKKKFLKMFLAFS